MAKECAHQELTHISQYYNAHRIFFGMIELICVNLVLFYVLLLSLIYISRMLLFGQKFMFIQAKFSHISVVHALLRVSPLDESARI